MSWIALKMLVGDRAKFYGIVMGLTFAALLITQQGSIFCGLMLRTAGQISDITGADLWVMDPNVRFIDDVKPMIENNLYRVRGVEGVLWAVPLYKGNARAKLNSTGYDGTRHEVIEQIILLGLDDTSMVGAPPPQRILEGDLINLRKPDAVMVDSTRLQKLYPGEDWGLLEANGKLATSLSKEVQARFLAAYGSIPAGDDGRVKFFKTFIGRDLEMNDRRAVIVAVCEATRTFQSNAVFYTTYSRAKQYAPQERKVLSYILAKTEPGLAPQDVAKRITEQTDLGAKTSDEFTWMTIDYYLKYTGIPINFGITAVLGFLVGTAIAGQTFYNFTLENLKQFGALKAMGATNLTIVRMILLQATVVGLLGYGIGVGAAALFGARSKGTELAFYTPWQLLPITGVAVVFICMLASILSVRRVIVLEPAVVFRG
ncbi:ABC transporter permease [Isosphaeraceae bacterium EP7]